MHEIRRVGTITFIGCQLLSGASWADTSSVEAPSVETSGPDSAHEGNQSNALEEVLVTATRQAKPLSKVPISVAVLSQETMDQEHVLDIDDVARLVPGINLTPLGSNDISGMGRTIAIRGISSTVGAATTGIYIDDTPIQVRSLGYDTTNVYPEVFDLDRIEVLRGPQGTLFGAGAEGGAIRFITPQPSLTTFSSYDRAELSTTRGGDMSYEAGGAVGGPLIDNELGFRVSAWYRRDGGYIDRVDPISRQTLEPNANSTDNIVLRAALSWIIADQLKATLSVYNQSELAHGTPLFFESFSSPGQDRFRSGNTIPQYIADRFTLPSLNLAYSADTFEVISTTSNFHRNIDRRLDYSAFIGTQIDGNPFFYGPGAYSEAFINDTQRSLTQEVRVQSNTHSKLAWVFGAYYGDARQTTYELSYDPYFNSTLQSLGVPGIPLLYGTSLYQTNGTSVDDQKALFAQADYELVPGLKVIGGVRVSRTTFSATRNSEGPIAGPGGVQFGASESETPVTPKYGVSYQLNPANMAYVTVSKGFRVGGVNQPTLSYCQPELESIGLKTSPESYKSDTVWSYEVGVKNRLFGGVLQLDTSIYDIEWRNTQRSIALANCGDQFITNLGSARSKGLDVALGVHPIEALTLTATAAYTDARLTQTVLGPTSSAGIATVYARQGDPIGVVPWSATASAEFAFALFSQRGYARSDFQHVSAAPMPDYTVYGADPEVAGSQSYSDISLRLGIRTASLDISAFVNNATNETQSLARFRYTVVPNDQLFLDSTLRPRTIGVTAVHRY
jgi:iron complex outermembrane recepter protein